MLNYKKFGVMFALLPLTFILNACSTQEQSDSAIEKQSLSSSETSVHEDENLQALDNGKKLVIDLSDEKIHLYAQDTSSQTINFLILGSDSRISGGNESNWQNASSRTDAIMIL